MIELGPLAAKDPNHWDIWVFYHGQWDFEREQGEWLFDEDEINWDK